MGDLDTILDRIASKLNDIERRIEIQEESDPLRHLELKGPDVASAASITLGQGNFFVITGVANIDNISVTGWSSGAIITLRFSGILTVNHLSGGSGQINLCTGAGFTTAADNMLGLVLDGTIWREIFRCT